MKFAAVCGSGLGSSFMMEMNIKNVLNELGVHDVEVTHFDMGSASIELADVFFVAKDLKESASHLGEVVVLNSIIDMDELRQKVTGVCKEKGLI